MTGMMLKPDVRTGYPGPGELGGVLGRLLDAGDACELAAGAFREKLREAV